MDIYCFDENEKDLARNLLSSLLQLKEAKPRERCLLNHRERREGMSN